MDKLKEDLQKIKEIVEKNTEADDFMISGNSQKFSQVRFASNMPTQNLSTENENTALSVSFGQRNASIDFSGTDQESVLKALKKVEETAKLSPENKENMPSLGPDQSVEKSVVDEDFSQFTLESRMQLADQSIVAADKAGIQCSGKVIAEKSSSGIAGKNGVLSFYHGTKYNYEHTYQRDREASKSRIISPYLKNFDTSQAAAHSVEELDLISPRKEFKVGRYPVVISSEAVAQMMPFFFYHVGDRRAADEGRSAFSGKIGEKVAADNINFYTDPNHEFCPSSPYNHEGVRQGRHYLLREGHVNEVSCDRFWAKENGYTPWSMVNMIMDGGSKSDQELISQIDDGFYITDIWYVRAVKVQDLTMTGMTRNALIKIENGQLVDGATHFRWNISFFDLFKQIRELGQCHYQSGWRGSGRYFPSLLVDDFYFSSPSSA